MINEAGVRHRCQPTSRSIAVFISRSCTSQAQPLLAMNNGDRSDGTENDGFVSLINLTALSRTKWIGVTRDGLEHHPLGALCVMGCSTPDVGYVRLLAGQPLKSVVVRARPFSMASVTEDGTVMHPTPATPSGLVTADKVAVFAEGAPLNVPMVWR